VVAHISDNIILKLLGKFAQDVGHITQTSSFWLIRFLCAYHRIWINLCSEKINICSGLCRPNAEFGCSTAELGEESLRKMFSCSDP
jgi:hypothetical protein